jgi:hypothetical protein
MDRRLASRHHVDLFCAGTPPGGHAQQATGMLGVEGLGGIFDYQEQAVKRYSVNIKPGQQAGFEVAGTETELIGDVFEPQGVLQAMKKEYELAMKLTT